MARASALAFALVALLATLPVSAQTLQHVTVTQFTLASDTNAPAIEESFHLIVTVHVRERVSSLANLDLPVLAELELVGDERRLRSDRNGTTYREVIGVVAHHTGDIHVAPVTLDAVDPRDQRAKRYFSNDLTVHVGGGTLEPLRSAGNVAGSILRTLATLVVWVVCFAAAVFVAVAIYRRRRSPVRASVSRCAGRIRSAGRPRAADARCASNAAHRTLAQRRFYDSRRYAAPRRRK